MGVLADKLTVFGDPVDQNAVEQIANCLKDERAVAGALMADHHKGYSLPVGGVIEYEGAISPSGVGYDIACGNKAVRTNISFADLHTSSTRSVKRTIRIIDPIMRAIAANVNFGMGGNTGFRADHELFGREVWIDIERLHPGLRQKAQTQLGTVGSGNHYVDILVDEADGQIWVANHFGSRGLGHTIATGVMNLNDNLDWRARRLDSEVPSVIDDDTDLGQFYIDAMNLAGEYAYAGRDLVIDQVLKILGVHTTLEVHNHHNFAWKENGRWVIRKGATPLTTEPAFIGGSMGDISVIVRGRPTGHVSVPDFVERVEDIGALGSAPHGAGRVMSRTQAGGKFRKMWRCPNWNCTFVPVRSIGGSDSGHPKNKCPLCGIPLVLTKRMRDASTGQINWREVRADLRERGIVVIGADAEEAPGVYKSLETVLDAHSNIEVLHVLQPLGVVMAGPDIDDPYKD